MRKLGIFGVVALALALLAIDAMAGRGRGGAVRGGVRGAMVGEMVGGESGAQTGAVIGATRGAAQRTAMVAETRARNAYEDTAEYQNAQHSNFAEETPEVMVTSPSSEPATPGAEAVIRKDGKPVLGITYPSDWKQKTGDNYIAAVSKDGHAWSVIAALDVNDKKAGIQKVKQGLEKFLTGVQYDKATKTEKGALVVTGTGKGKKSGVDVVFAAGILDSGPGQFAGAAFIVDSNVEQHYKETVRYICQTIRRAPDLAK